MGFKAFDHCVSVIAFQKNNKKYGMTCAWGMQVDYDKIVCLLGSQSDTGKVVEAGDIIGVSVLAKTQTEIANHFGEGHSTSLDKFNNGNWSCKDSAILIPFSAREMVCEVMEVFHLREIEEDSLLYLRIKESKENSNEFLHYGDL